MDILKFPDSRLKLVSVPVTDFDDNLAELAKQMLVTMYAAPGIGLAAPQVGHPLRMIAVDTDWVTAGERTPTVAINPQIFGTAGKKIKGVEACLSVPGLEAEVERDPQIKVQYHDLEGTFHVESLTEERAVCFQHEIDHLDGILFIDRISRLKRSMYVNRRRKQLRQGGA